MTDARNHHLPTLSAKSSKSKDHFSIETHTLMACHGPFPALSQQVTPFLEWSPHWNRHLQPLGIPKDFRNESTQKSPKNVVMLRRRTRWPRMMWDVAGMMWDVALMAFQYLRMTRFGTCTSCSNLGSNQFVANLRTKRVWRSLLAFDLRSNLRTKFVMETEDSCPKVVIKHHQWWCDE